ncbi:hypothetical protein LguiA_001944 [Lonicera macranthoides]
MRVNCKPFRRTKVTRFGVSSQGHVAIKTCPSRIESKPIVNLKLQKSYPLRADLSGDQNQPLDEQDPKLGKSESEEVYIHKSSEPESKIVHDLQSDVDDFKFQARDLKAEVLGLKAEVLDLESKVPKCRSQLPTLTIVVVDLKPPQVNDLKVVDPDLKSQVHELKAKFLNLRSRIFDLLSPVPIIVSFGYASLRLLVIQNCSTCQCGKDKSETATTLFARSSTLGNARFKATKDADLIRRGSSWISWRGRFHTAVHYGLTHYFNKRDPVEDQHLQGDVVRGTDPKVKATISRSSILGGNTFIDGSDPSVVVVLSVENTTPLRITSASFTLLGAASDFGPVSWVWGKALEIGAIAYITNMHD